MLEKRQIQVDFTRSVDQRTATKLVLAGKLLTAQDVVWRGKTVERRTGYTALPTSILGGANITSLAKGYVYNNELLAQGSSLWSWSAQNSTWISKGTGFDLAGISKTPVYRSSAQVSESDCSTGAGFTCYLWHQQPNTSTDEIRAQVIDESVGTVITANALLSTGGANAFSLPKIIFFAGVFFAMWWEASTIQFSTWNSTNPNAGWTAKASLTASATGLKVLDAVVVNNRAFVTFNAAANPTSLIEVNSSGTIIGGPTSSGITGDNGVALGSSQDNFLYVVGNNSVNGLQRTVFDLTCTVTQAAATIEVGFNIQFLVAGFLSRATSCDLYYSPSGIAVNTNPATRSVNLTSSGTIGTLNTFQRGAVVASMPFLFGGREYIWLSTAWGIPLSPFPNVQVGRSICLFEDTLQNGTASRIAAQALFGTARSYVAGANGVRVAQTLLDSQSRPFTTWLEQFIFQLSNTQNTSAVGIARVTASPQGTSPITSAQFGGVVVTGGGFLSIYDGANPVELGFLQYPEVLTMTTSTTGGNLGNGNYQVALTYEWTDNAGNRYQSAPTPAQTIATGAGTTNSIVVTGPMLRHTNKITPRVPARIVVWRTVLNGSTLFRDTPLNNSILNNTTTDTLGYTIIQADSAVNSNEILYTGRALSNIAPPAARYVVAHQNRLFLMGMEDPNLIWYSRKYVSGDGINFNDGLTLRVDAPGGALMGGASLDDKLVCFKETASYYFQGDGPNDLGQQNTFTPQPQPISGDIGCADARTIVKLPFGVIFLSKKGFWLLDRGLTPHYIGAPVENLVNPFGQPQLVFTSVQVLPKKNQVRWTTASGTCLLLDYTDAIAMDADPTNMDVYKWSVFTNYAAVDSAIWQSNFVHIGSDNAVCQDSDSTNSDTRIVAGVTSTSGISGIAETSWIHLAGIQGFQRVWRALLAGATQGGAHSPTITVAFDYDGNQYTFGNPYSPIGGMFIPLPLPTAEPLQIRHGLYKETCEAVKFRIAFTPEINQAPWRLEDLTLEVGIKKGAFKLPAAVSLG